MIGVDELVDFDHDRGRSNVPKRRLVRVAHLLPSLDVRDEQPRPDDVMQRSVRGGQGLFDVFEGGFCMYASAGATTFPSSSVAVVPETWIVSPTRTARE